jgi:uncharacterized membrane protein
MSSQPVVWVTLVEAVLVLLVAFGVDITPQQLAAITGVVLAIGGVFTWRRVTPVDPSTGEPVNPDYTLR